MNHNSKYSESAEILDQIRNENELCLFISMNLEKIDLKSLETAILINNQLQDIYDKLDSQGILGQEKQYS